VTFLQTKSSRDPFLELSGRPRLDNRQTFFRLVTSRYARLEKSIILASAVSYQNHPLSFPKIPSGADSRNEGESEHHPA